jgi:hypothetical protein
MRRIVASLVLLVALAGLSACSSYDKKMASFREAYWAADYPRANAEIDAVIAASSGAKKDVVVASHALDSSVKADKGDTYLYLLDKGMVELADGRPENAVNLWRRARDEMDVRMSSSLAAHFAAVFSDDTALNYNGADYEHVMVRVMLAIADLVAGGGDARAYAFQVGEKQEQILGSPLGQEAGYKPREHYRRVGAGAYVQGISLESDGAVSEAERVFRRMLDYEPGSLLGKAGLERAAGGVYAPAGNGVLHVFYLAGRGPYLVEGTSPATDQAMMIAQVATTVVTGTIAPLVQTAVPVPVLAVVDPSVGGLSVRAGEALIGTENLLDVNGVAREQLEAMSPMVIARAILRRAAKTAVTSAVEKVGQDVARGGGDNENGGKRRVRGDSGPRNGNGRERDAGAEVAGTAIQIAAILGNLLWTATENADTRCWTTLPATVQAGRMELAAGDHRIELGDGSFASVKITAGRDSYLVIVRPNLAKPGSVLIDPYSRAEAGAGAAAAAASPQSPPAAKPN